MICTLGRRRVFCLGAVLAYVAVAAACGGRQAAAPTAPGAAPANPTLDQAFQAALNDWAASPAHHGVSASVILPTGAQWTGVAGLAGSGPLQPDDLIAIASITKTMTAAVILQLADEGRLTLDDAVSRWLSPRANVDPAITVRQLLNHTNGLDNYTTSAALGQAIAADPDHVFTPAELLGFLGPPHFPPGERTEYTNTAFLLLGQIAEQVTGQSIDSLWRSRLWGPLGLRGIFLPGLEAPPGPVAPARTTSGVVAPLARLSTLTAGSTAFGLMATARDIAVWGHALFAGTVISPVMQQEMRALVPAAGNIPGETGAGLGIRGYAYLGRMQIGHSGGSSFGSSLLLHDPDAGVTVVVLMNQSQGADHFVLAPALLNLALTRR
ncbi:MAG: serine hydrolase domain-containing protein [Vicinamibacterales bacterium]